MWIMDCFRCFLLARPEIFDSFWCEFTQSAVKTLSGKKFDDLGHQCDGLFMNYYTILQDSHRLKHFSVDDFLQAWLKTSCILLHIREILIHPTCCRPHFLAAGIILLAVILTWLMMDTARIFFLPALSLGPTMGRQSSQQLETSPKSPHPNLCNSERLSPGRFFWSKYLHLSPEMSAATLLVTSLGFLGWSRHATVGSTPRLRHWGMELLIWQMLLIFFCGGQSVLIA